MMDRLRELLTFNIKVIPKDNKSIEGSHVNPLIRAYNVNHFDDLVQFLCGLTFIPSVLGVDLSTSMTIKLISSQVDNDITLIIGRIISDLLRDRHLPNDKTQLIYAKEDIDIPTIYLEKMYKNIQIMGAQASGDNKYIFINHTYIIINPSFAFRHGLQEFESIVNKNFVGIQL